VSEYIYTISSLFWSAYGDDEADALPIAFTDKDLAEQHASRITGGRVEARRIIDRLPENVTVYNAFAEIYPDGTVVRNTWSAEQWDISVELGAEPETEEQVIDGGHSIWVKGTNEPAVEAAREEEIQRVLDARA
jgi:hypothetical protein